MMSTERCSGLRRRAVQEDGESEDEDGDREDEQQLEMLASMLKGKQRRALRALAGALGSQVGLHGMTWLSWQSLSHEH